MDYVVLPVRIEKQSYEIWRRYFNSTLIRDLIENFADWLANDGDVSQKLAMYYFLLSYKEILQKRLEVIEERLEFLKREIDIENIQLEMMEREAKRKGEDTRKYLFSRLRMIADACEYNVECVERNATRELAALEALGIPVSRQWLEGYVKSLGEGL